MSKAGEEGGGLLHKYVCGGEGRAACFTAKGSLSQTLCCLSSDLMNQSFILFGGQLASEGSSLASRNRCGENCFQQRLG